MKKDKQEPQEDARLKATAVIWGISTGMLGISIPLSDVTHSVLIPVFVIIGAAVGTCGVWFFGNKNQSNVPIKSNLAAEQRIAELEERLDNLETINNFERRLAEEALKRHDANQNAVPSGEVMPDEQGEATTESPARRLTTDA